MTKMTTEVGQCKICFGFYRMKDGRLPEHPHLVTGNPCRGRWPDNKPCYQEEPENSVFIAASAGLPTLGKGHR